MHRVRFVVQKYYADARRELCMPYLPDIDSDCDKP